MHSTTPPIEVKSDSPIVKDVQAKPALAQRAACDRCRGQKLRCPRTKPGSQSVCDRCQRIGAICRTAPRLPSGRPSLRGSERSISKSKSKRNKTCSARRTTALTVKPLTAPITLPSPSTSATHSPVLDAEPDQSHALAFDQPSPFDLDHTTLFGDTTTAALDTFDPALCYDFDFGAPSPENSHDSTTCLDTTFDIFESDLSQFSGSSSYESLSSRDGRKYQFLDQSSQDTDVATEEYHPFATPRLFVESISAISERISDLQEHRWLASWDPAGASEESLPNTPTATSTSMENDGFNHALRVLTEFYVLSCSKGTHFSTSVAASLETRHPTSLSTTLMLLSAYVQVGQLMGSLLIRIKQRCEDMKLDILSVPNDSTYIITAWQHNLFTKVQLLESHCNSMEHNMGQSTDACKIEAEDLKSKIFCVSAESSSILIRTMTSQAHETFRSLRSDFERVKREILGLSAVA